MPATMPGDRLRLAIIPTKLSNRLQGSGVAPALMQQGMQAMVEEIEVGRAYTDALRMLIGHFVKVIAGQRRIGAMQEGLPVEARSVSRCFQKVGYRSVAQATAFSCAK